MVRESSKDEVLVVGGGVTVYEALKAADLLKEKGVCVRVVDIFSVKPVDKEGLRKNAALAKNRVIVVEDHYPEGGIYCKNFLFFFIFCFFFLFFNCFSRCM